MGSNSQYYPKIVKWDKVKDLLHTEKMPFNLWANECCYENTPFEKWCKQQSIAPEEGSIRDYRGLKSRPME
jgi:hypothetical protein